MKRKLFIISFSILKDNEAARRRRRRSKLKTFILQAAQKGLEARRARIEQRSVLKTYVSSEIRSATQNMSLFQQSVKASVYGACRL